MPQGNNNLYQTLPFLLETSEQVLGDLHDWFIFYDAITPACHMVSMNFLFGCILK